MKRYRILVAAVSIAFTFDASAVPLAALYPPEEHCIFIPPPPWAAIVVLDRRQACTLEMDRALALNAAAELEADNRWIIQRLTPDQGFSTKSIEQSDPMLQRQVRRSFENFLTLWRAVRRNGESGQLPSIVGRFREACERGALLTLWQDEEGQANAGVVSLITGNVLADGPVETVGSRINSNCQN